MKWHWSVAFVLLVAPAAALTVDTPIQFTGPAVLAGDVEIQAQGAWGAVGFARDLEGDVALQAARVDWHQLHASGARMTGQISGTPGHHGQETPTESLSQVAARLDAPQTWGIRVVGGDVEALGSATTLLGAAGPSQPTRHAPNDWPAPNIRAPPSLQGSSVAGTADVDTIHVQGDFQVEFFGLQGQLQSAQGDRSLSSGYQQTIPLPNNEGHVDYVVYDVLWVQAGRLTIPASQAHFAYYATDLDLRTNGTGHFPLVAGASLPGLGQRASDGTWLVDGQWNLTDVRPGVEGMQARIDGDASSFLLDGQQVADLDAQTLAAVAGIGLGAIALGVMAKLAYGAALFTRMDGQEALQHDRRQLLYAFIQENPGATFREVCRQTDVPSGTARHHLSVLARSRLITERRHRSTVRFFENHGKFDQNWNEVVLLREEGLAQVHAWVRKNPDCIQKDILEAADSWGWSRSTTQHRIGRLVKEGLLEVRPMGRRKLYSVAEPTRTQAHPLGWRRELTT